MNHSQFIKHDKHESLNTIVRPSSKNIILKEQQSPYEILIIEPSQPENLDKRFSAPLSLDGVLGVSTDTRQRFGMRMALLERDHPLDALGAKIVAIGQQHLDIVDRELAAIRAEG